jgi:5'(3')-deoxyribonucleotidase
MSGKRQLAIDVDNTVIDTNQGWYDYLKYYNGLAKMVKREDGMLPYNLAEIFPSVQEPMLYWKQLDYFQFEPIEGSVRVLEMLSQYFDIVFLSQQSGTHGRSKYYWLEEWFPFKKAVVLTHEKFVFNDAVVALVDDRKEHLKGFDLNKRILFDTPYDQSVECDVNMVINKWSDEVVERICKEYL